jgi:hypothetical protein
VVEVDGVEPVVTAVDTNNAQISYNLSKNRIFYRLEIGWLSWKN